MKKLCCILILCFSSLFYLQGFAQVDSVYYRASTWTKTMQKFAELDTNTKLDKKNLVLFIGSSSFTRWDNIEKYFPESNVLNRGFGGSHASDLIYYAEQIIFPYQPSQIVIYEGDNDIGSGMSVEDYLVDVKALIRMIEIRMPGVPIVVLSTKSCPRRDKSRQRYEEANARMYEYAMSKPHITYVDVYSLLLDNMGNYRTELFAEDMLHINAEAYKLWADRLRPHLLKK